MKKIFLTGSLQVDIDQLAEFDEAKTKLEAEGFEVVSVLEIGNDADFRNLPVKEIVRKRLNTMLDCDGVTALDSFVIDRMAKAEVDVARLLGMDLNLYKILRDAKQSNN
jgi:nucleoside 2-deoxyribosyltransferase